MPLVLATGALAQETPREIPPPSVPPKTIPMGEWNVVAESQELEGSVYRLHGHPAELEDSRLLFRADEIELDEETGDVRAKGNVFFWSFDTNMKLWASRVEYNTDAERGQFYDVIGETQPKIVARRGVLTGSAPFHFEGQWAERIGEKYILYHGWVTNCKLPIPWWRLKGSRFDIIPDDRAITHTALHSPALPDFLHAVLLPLARKRAPQERLPACPTSATARSAATCSASATYWAINRSYRPHLPRQDYTARGSPTTSISAPSRARLQLRRRALRRSGPRASRQRQSSTTYSGLSLYAVGRSDLGNGWTARGTLNYISSFRFRQEWSSRTTKPSAPRSTRRFLTKNWSTYTFDIAAARIQNFESTEIPNHRSRSPRTPSISHQRGDHPQTARSRASPAATTHIFGNLPVWFRFDSTAGLLYRSSPGIRQQ